jgi:hypothetical protein
MGDSVDVRIMLRHAPASMNGHLGTKLSGITEEEERQPRRQNKARTGRASLVLAER